MGQPELQRGSASKRRRGREGERGREKEREEETGREREREGETGRERERPARLVLNSGTTAAKAGDIETHDTRAPIETDNM